MRKVISCLGPLLLVTIALAGCGGGMSSTQTPLGASMSQVSLTIHDNPPMGVTVLSFEIEVSGAALQPSDSSSQPVSMLSEPEDIELEHLQTESALLASRNVPTGAYSGLMVSFANPRMTIQNQTGTTLTLGTKTCSDQQVCEFDPKLNQSSVTVEAPTTPFPITLTMNSPVVLKLDFNLDTSIQQSDLSITPTVSLVQLPPPNSSGGDQGDEDMELIGQVASIDQTMHTFTIQTGSVTSVSTSSFQIVLFDEEFFGGGDEMGSFSMGVPLTINLAPQATFSIDTSSFMLPSGLNFASIADLMVGQEVRLHPTAAPTGTPPNLMVTVDQVQLEPSRVTGTVTAVNTGSNPQTFTLGNLPSFFTNAGITSIQVDVLATTQFETEEDQTFSGLSSLKPGDVVSVRGPLFNTMTMPTMAAEKVVKRSMSSGTSD
ncbi:MAG: hypothetical protein DMG53_21800 [Acidobacteria bacterium]|nr:MAG: hypothetical protein DMG53_21800 [Acidobacteriota bacterium]